MSDIKDTKKKAPERGQRSLHQEVMRTDTDAGENVCDRLELTSVTQPADSRTFVILSHTSFSVPTDHVLDHLNDHGFVNHRIIALLDSISTQLASNFSDFILSLTVKGRTFVLSHFGLFFFHCLLTECVNSPKEIPSGIELIQIYKGTKRKNPPKGGRVRRQKTSWIQHLPTLSAEGLCSLHPIRGVRQDRVPQIIHTLRLIRIRCEEQQLVRGGTLIQMITDDFVGSKHE